MRFVLAAVFLVLVSFTLHSNAEPPKSVIAPQLWKFEKDGRHFYVLGSLHTVGARYFPQWVLKLITQSSKLVFEVDVDPATKAIPEMALPEGQTLQSLISPKAWQKLMAEVGPHLSPADQQQLQRLSPLGAFLFITEARRQFVKASSDQLRQLADIIQNFQGAMDYDIMKLARERNIPVGGLETAAEQLASIPVSIGELENLIMESPEKVQKDLEAFILGNAVMTFRYFDGDVAILKSAIRELPREAYLNMFRKRNLAWISKLEELPDNSFVVAGGGHLVGREGLLALMHVRGWSLTRIQNCDQLLSSE